MSRSSNGWIVILVLLGIMLAVVGGGVMGGVVGMYVARGTAAPVAAPVPQEIKAVTPGQAPAVQNLTVNTTTELIGTVQKVEPAVVTVVTDLNTRSAGEVQASGSGVIISQDGHIITNNHVVEGASSVSVIYEDGTRTNATIVGTDPVTDIAVLKVNDKVPTYVPFGDSNALQLGEWVIAIGSPLGNYRGSVTVGVVSGLNRSVDGTQQEGLIQTDAAINHGNSGGPLINLAGQIVGINTLVVRESVGGAPAEGLGFAVPSNIVRAVAEQLIARGKIEYPFIGISYQEVTPQLASELGLAAKNGVLIQQITAGSPAARAGLQMRDVVTAIDNKAIDENTSLRSLLFQYHVGDTVTLTVERGGQPLQVKVTLVARPS
ncbi:MAG: PDZ domain-containing protein [Chloroflexota bacterium]|nr:MAG: PDZ domain-containing protein [Chloroflexota bacterium]